MSHSRRTTAVGVLLLLGAVGCSNLDIQNPNDPDRAKALASANDVESLVGGSLSSWWSASHTYYLLPFSTASFQHSAPWNNFGMVPLSAIPRNPWVNESSDPYYSAVSSPWASSYQALASANAGLRSVGDPSTGLADQLGPDRVTRLTAWGKFVQGLSLGELALLYDQVFVVDETTQITDASGKAVPQDPVPAAQAMTAALQKFDEAISIAESSDFTIPASWAISTDISSADLAKLAHSYKAVFAASVARTPADAATVDWNQVLADVDAGIKSTFVVDADFDTWYDSYLDYGTFPTWQQLNYMIDGMADQSGHYQTWLSTPVLERMPTLGGVDMLIVTPDKRFPQGSTVDEQLANPGTNWIVPSIDNEASQGVGSQWAKPDRGTWRWSWYWNKTYMDYNYGADSHVPLIKLEEMNLLAAEAKYMLNDKAGAAELVNLSRTAAGLNATDASGTNTSCVPKLPDGSCGDLFEMLKWEKRQETWMVGAALGLSWYFDGRRWGDLYKGTPLEVSIPCQEVQTLQIEPCVTTGGVGGVSASEGSSYAWPGEAS